MDGRLQPKQPIVVATPEVAEVLRNIFAIFDRCYPANLPAEKLRAMGLMGDRDLGACPVCQRRLRRARPIQFRPELAEEAFDRGLCTACLRSWRKGRRGNVTAAERDLAS
jgi:hypothetical protein